MQVSVQLLSTTTSPILKHVRNAIELWQYPRSMEVCNLPNGVNKGALRQDLCVTCVTPGMKRAGSEVVASFSDGGHWGSVTARHL